MMEIKTGSTEMVGGSTSPITTEIIMCLNQYVLNDDQKNGGDDYNDDLNDDNDGGKNRLH